uniref:Uncharacterized protein n=1 Tax=Ciona intestinalis TaxID=7719 RepID=H2XPL1_CIOIN
MLQWIVDYRYALWIWISLALKKQMIKAGIKIVVVSISLLVDHNFPLK